MTERRHLDADSEFYESFVELKRRVNDLERLANPYTIPPTSFDAHIGPIGSPNLEGAGAEAWYSVKDGECHCWGYYAIGSSTNWVAGRVYLWVPIASGSLTGYYSPVGIATAYNGSTGAEFIALMVFTDANQTGCAFFGPTLNIGSTHYYWDAQAGGTTRPFGEPYVNGDSIKWDMRYQVDL